MGGGSGEEMEEGGLGRGEQEFGADSVARWDRDGVVET